MAEQKLGAIGRTSIKNHSIGVRVFRALFSLVFLGIGVWVIVMAIQGETPAEPLEDLGHQIIMGIFGGMFCAIGFMGVVHALLSGRPNGPTIVAGIATVVLVLFGLCFLSVAILKPEEIVATSSINGVEVSKSKGGWSGIVVFSAVGVLPLIFSRHIYRKYKKTLEKDN
jgi:hypothetical protein